MATDATVTPSTASHCANPSLSINLDAATYRRLTNFAHIAGMTYTQAASEALGEWLDTTGEAMIVCQQMRQDQRQPRSRARSARQSHVLTMPAPTL